jgi:hypothetical protein
LIRAESFARRDNSQAGPGRPDRAIISHPPVFVRIRVLS